MFYSDYNLYYACTISSLFEIKITQKTIQS